MRAGLETLPPRIVAKFDVQGTGCWDWNASTTGSGYGKVWWNGRLWQAHRAIYTILVAPVPAHLDLDHYVCERHICVCPDHVRPATRRENILRGDTIPSRALAATHCPKGHPYDDENTYVRKHGGRDCRVCHRESDRARYWASK